MQDVRAAAFVAALGPLGEIPKLARASIIKTYPSPPCVVPHRRYNTVPRCPHQRPFRVTHSSISQCACAATE
jgi:hypothetical protein